MGKFIVRDKHIAFVNAVISGMPQYQAYIEFISPSKKLKKATAEGGAHKLMKRSDMKNLMERIRAERQNAITAEISRNVGKEFQALILSTEEIDAFHSAVLQGQVEVEEVIIMKTLQYDDKGNVIKKSDTPMRIKRGPNIREKQISAQELYRRRGNYAPTKLMGAFGKVDDEGNLENVQRFVVLSNGERIPL
jgi:hypothetical protein